MSLFTPMILHPDKLDGARTGGQAAGSPDLVINLHGQSRVTSIKSLAVNQVSMCATLFSTWSAVQLVST